MLDNMKQGWQALGAGQVLRSAGLGGQLWHQSRPVSCHTGSKSIGRGLVCEGAACAMSDRSCVSVRLACVVR